MTDSAFLTAIADTLHALPGVHAVSLGGSRAQGRERPDSDWDLALYYRGAFDPEDLRSVGWEGEVSELGAWGGGVFNGGAWLRVEGRAVDVHYRDLDVVDAQVARASRGEFDIEPLMFHLAGIPTYLVVGELGLHRVLRGTLPRVDYPEALRRSAPAVWSARADLTLDYAEHNHARAARATQCLGGIAVAATQYAHAILAARGEWVTNEKDLLSRAGLDVLHGEVLAARGEPDALRALVRDTRVRGQALVRDATG
ncbi:nucleotidyltransferase domain-containing protein [Actinoalloteichus sp. AHMU CJ021]|uniref:nucleotidyltransferase domain-containing protein n=1 Tax=Actinoalloteichus TaxID=65496 RepID=UPI000556EE40|nr:nucleotidyltransferase domain-containing protein [Actinoalloteichus caeruleus]AUS78172.1 nucleotidyltransferase domain-containing protein [Actinoalloteichus sp. AHMU CJ021]